MNFSLPHSIEILQQTPATLHQLLHQLSDEWTTVNEGPETWTPYDVIGHLLHGERTNWIQRVQVILSDKDDKNFPPFDRFAQFKESKGKTLEQLLQEFSEARKNNIKTLLQLNIQPADLGKTGIHPSFGEVTLSQLLSTWVVHDLDHIYQITRVMAKQYSEAVGPWVQFLKILREG